MIEKKECVVCPRFKKNDCEKCSNACMTFSDGSLFIDIPVYNELILGISIEDENGIDFPLYKLDEFVNANEDFVYFESDREILRIFPSTKYHKLTIHYDERGAN